MNLKDLFPTLGDNSEYSDNRNFHYTKKGPGRKPDRYRSSRTIGEAKMHGVNLYGNKLGRKALNKTLVWPSIFLYAK